MTDELAREVSRLAERVENMVARNSHEHERTWSTLKEISDKVDTASKAAIENNILMSQVHQTSKDHEARMRSLERWRFGLAGAMATLVAFGAYFVDLFKDKLTGS